MVINDVMLFQTNTSSVIRLSCCNTTEVVQDISFVSNDAITVVVMTGLNGFVSNDVITVTTMTWLNVT